MRRALTCLPLAVLFIANVVPSKAQSADAVTTIAPASTAKTVVAERPPLVAGGPDAPGPIQYYDVPRNASFLCSLPRDGTPAPRVVWEKNNTEITNVPELKDRFKLEKNGTQLVISRSVEEDYGNYSCKVGGARLYWQLHARPYAKLPSTDSSVVEGQKLKLVCRLVGKPAVPVQWYYNKDAPSYEAESEKGEKVVSTERVKLETTAAGLEDGELVIEAAAMSDSGVYSCEPLLADEDPARTPLGPARTMLRVKDMYAALWPFLGICAEVLVLCAIILVYEKRRTKPEMDDSDTDNHDQKKS